MTQPSSHQHYYLNQAQLYDANSLNLIDQGRLAQTSEVPYRLNMPALLPDGSYRIELLTEDVFDLKLEGVKPKPLICNWNLDTHYPIVQGFRESLNLISAADAKFLEVKPGQTLSLAVDESGDNRVNICLAPAGAAECNDFFQMKNAFYAPTSGSWRVFYYTKDLAGNRSPINVLADLAVINRDLLQSFR